MTIVVQTVGLVDGANSYISAADAVSYAADRGTTITTLLATPLIYKSMDVIENNFYKGYLVDSDQSTKAPRDGIINGETGLEYTRQQVLDRFKLAQKEMVLQMFLGYDPQGISNEQRIKSESFGPFSTTYMDDPDPINYLYNFNKLLAPFISGIFSNGIHFKLKGPIF